MFNSRPTPLTSEVRINTSKTRIDAEELKNIFRDVATTVLKETQKATKASERIGAGRRKPENPFDSMYEQAVRNASKAEQALQKFDAQRERRLAYLTTVSQRHEERRTNTIQQAVARRSALLEQQAQIIANVNASVERERLAHTKRLEEIQKTLDVSYAELMQRRVQQEIETSTTIESIRYDHTRRMRKLEQDERALYEQSKNIADPITRGKVQSKLEATFDRRSVEEIARTEKQIADIQANHRRIQRQDWARYHQELDRMEAKRVQSAQEYNQKLVQSQSTIRNVNARTNEVIRKLHRDTTKRLETDLRSTRSTFYRVYAQIRDTFSNTARAHLESSMKIAQQERLVRDTIRNSMADATKAVAKFNMAKAKLGETLRHIAWEMRIFAGAMAGFIFLGIRNADALELMETRYEALFGSMEEGRRQMDRIAVSATRMGAPVRSTQRAFAGLIPSIQDSNGSIDQYINLALRLATLNPAEGLEGAVYSIREALVSGGSDLQSMVERFNIPRNTFKSLVAQTGDFARAMDIMLDSQGATTKVAEQNAKSIRNMTATIRDSLTQAFERAFIPMLDTAQKVAKLFNEAIQNTPTWALQLAGAFAVVSGTVTGIVAVGQMAYNTMSKLADAYQYATVMVNQYRLAVLASNTATTASAGAPVMGAVGGTTARIAQARVPTLLGTTALSAGSTVAGVQIGALLPKIMTAFGTLLKTVGVLLVGAFKLIVAGIVTGVVAFAIGFIAYHISKLVLGIMDSVFGSNLTKTVDNTIKQVFGLVGIAVIGAVDTFIIRPLAFIKTAFDSLTNILEYVRGEFYIFQGAISTFIGDLAQTISNLAPFLNISVDGEALSAWGQQRSEEGRAIQRTALDNIARSWEENYREMSAPLEELALKIWTAVESATDVTRAFNSLKDTLSPFISSLRVTYAELMGSLGDQYAKDIEGRISFAIDLDRLTLEGSVDEIGGMIDARTREREVTLQFIEELESWAVLSAEAQQKLDELNASMALTNKELPMLEEALKLAYERRQEELRGDLRDVQARESDERLKGIREAYDKAQKAYDALDEEILEKAVDNEEKLRDIHETFDKEDQDRLESHRKKLRDIDKKYNDDVLLAQSRLDAQGVASAIKARKDAIEEAEEELAERQNKNKEKLNEDLAHYAKELENQQEANDKKRQAIKSALDDELWELTATYNSRVSLAQATLNNELMLLDNYYNDRYEKLRLSLQREQELEYITPYQKIVGQSAGRAIGVIVDMYNELWETYGTPIANVSSASARPNVYLEYATGGAQSSTTNNITIVNPNPDTVLDRIKRLVVRGAG